MSKYVYLKEIEDNYHIVVNEMDFLAYQTVKDSELRDFVKKFSGHLLNMYRHKMLEKHVLTDDKKVDDDK